MKSTTGNRYKGMAKLDCGMIIKPHALQSRGSHCGKAEGFTGELAYLGSHSLGVWGNGVVGAFGQPRIKVQDSVQGPRSLKATRENRGVL